jgi:hypothetical protein
MLCTPLPSLFYNSNYTGRRAYKEFSSTCHFISPWSNYSHHHVLKHSILSVRYKVLRTYRTKGKIIISYILIFTFLDNRREDKKLWTEWYQALLEFSLLLISSLITFLFVTVISKYLNCVTMQSKTHLMISVHKRVLREG